ncbi:MAG: DUF1801 domain-containing protein, partial [Gloeobacteraceae cyanobacterium ES-bin-316]|nr:DUF1801 domain-containing protein [Ferruginibacter sp.]
MDEVEKYIVAFEPEIQSKLRDLRGVFFNVLPEVKECIRYKMPAYKLGEVYLYFAAYKKHIGFYPVYNLKEIEGEI